MSFDPEKFMNAAVDPNATVFEVCPEGEYPMMIDTDPKQLIPEELSGVSSKSGQPYHFWQMNLNCIVNSDAVKAKLGREKVTVRLRLNLDFDAVGNLETGPNKNVSLGQLRDALSQNQPGWTPARLLGAGPFIGKVKNTTDPKDPNRKYADVVKTGKVV